MTRAAGWYPDPADSHRWRWWDGDAWTTWLTDDASSAPPPVPDPEPVKPHGPFLLRLVVGVIAVAVLAVVALTTWGMLTAPAETPVTRPPVSAAPTVARPSVARATDGSFTIAGYVSARCPEAPFASQRGSAQGISRDLVTCQDTAESRSGLTNTSGSSIVIVQLAPETVVPGDLDRTTVGTLSELAHRLFAKAPSPKFSTPEAREIKDYGDKPARRAELTVTHRDGGAEHRDTVSLLVIDCGDGVVFGWLELRTEQIRPEAAAAMDAARAGIKLG